MIYIDPDELSKKHAYFLSTSVIVPRPIALITTLNEDNSINAAPFSYFMGISSQPAFIAFSIADGREGRKDTLKNIFRQKEFVVHIPIRGMEEDVNICGIDFPYGESEVQHTKFSFCDCKLIRGKRINEIPAAMECRYVRSIDDLGNFTLVIAQVLCYSVQTDYYHEQEKIFEYDKTVTLGRMGKSDYVYADSLISVPRLSYQDFKKDKS